MNLDSLADDISAGRLELWQLPTWAFELWHAGFYARDPEIDHVRAQLAQAEADADRYYEMWANPGKKLTEARTRRIREALARAAEGEEPLTGVRQVEICVDAAMPPKRRAA